MYKELCDENLVCTNHDLYWIIKLRRFKKKKKKKKKLQVFALSWQGGLRKI